jgi:hypothetical protein
LGAEPGEKLIGFAEATVADVGAAGPGIHFGAEGFALAGFASGDLDAGRCVLEQIERNVEAHGVAFAAFAPAAAERPRHARQGGKKRTVARHPALRVEAGRDLLQIGQFARETGKERLQQGRIDQMLRLRKAPEADFGDARLRAHFGQRDGLDEAAHGACDGIEKTEQKEAEVSADLEMAFGVGKGAVQGRWRHGEEVIEHLAEACQHLQGTKPAYPVKRLLK